MAKDFLSNQIRVKKLIGNGSGTDPKLIVYSDTNASGSTGSVNDSKMLSNVGDDVFLFVSGSICGKQNNIPDSVTVFGGDVVVSGSLYSEGNSSSLWEVDPTDSDSLIPTNIIDGHTGLFAMDFNTYIDFDGTVYQNSYTMSVNSCIVDTLFELDTSDQNDLNNIMPKL